MAEVTVEESTGLVKSYYADYAKYVLETRALPSIIDGLKFAQRRLVYVASKSGARFDKSSKILGNTIPYHPHSLDSLYGVLVGLTTNRNRYHLFQGKGNWGGVGFGAAAYRYTEAYLNELARFTYTQFVENATYVEGESGLQEPEVLPALVPYALLVGAQGIGVGLSTSIMPLDALELIDYYISVIKGENPKTPTPDLGNYILDMDDDEIDSSVEDYWGRVTIRSIITRESDHVLAIDDLYNRNIYTIVRKLGDWIDNGLVDFRDETTTAPRYVFEIIDDRVDIDELSERISTMTKVRKSFTRLLVENKIAKYTPLRYQVDKSLEYLNEVLDRKFSNELKVLEFNEQVLLAVQAMRDAKLIVEIPKLTTLQLKRKVRELGFEDKVAATAISKSISYLTKSHDQELRDIRKQIKSIKNTDRTKYLIDLYTELRKKFEPIYNQSKHSIRRSQLLTKHGFEFVDENTLRISDTGEPYEHAVFVLYKDGFGNRFEIGTNVRHDVSIIDTSDAIGAVSDKFNLITIVTNKNKAITVTTDRLDGRNLIRYENGEYAIAAYGSNKSNNKALFTDTSGNTYNALDYFRSRYATTICLRRV